MAEIAPSVNTIRPQAMSSERTIANDSENFEEILNSLELAVGKLSQRRSEILHTATVEARLREREAEIYEKDQHIEEIESALSTITAHGNKDVIRARIEKEKVQNLHDAVLKKLQETSEKNSLLEQKIRKLLADFASQNAQIQTLKNEIQRNDEEKISMKSVLKNETKLKEDLQAELNQKKDDLGSYESYQSNLEEIDMKLFRKEIDALWKRALTLARKYFLGDLIRQNFEAEQDNWVHDVLAFLTPLDRHSQIPPISKSNQTAAQFVRMGIALKIMAVAVTKYVFTTMANPTLSDGIDTILNAVSQDDEMKEKICRAILLSGEDQVRRGENSFPYLSTQLKDLIGKPLNQKAYNELAVDIDKYLYDARSLWEKKRYSSVKLVPTFDFKIYRDVWDDIPLEDCNDKQSSVQQDDSEAEDKDPIAFVVFPAIITIRNGKWCPIRAGIVIRHSHINHIRKERRLSFKEHSRLASLLNSRK